MTNIKINVGKLSSRGGGNPSDAFYVQQIKAQLGELNTILSKVCNDVEAATPYVILDALIPTYAKSQRYCPILTGQLASSGYLEITEFRGKPRVELGYGRGGQPPYAMTVHERVEVYHAPPTRSKFLQAAVLEDLPKIEKRIQDNYRNIWPDGGAS